MPRNGSPRDRVEGRSAAYQYHSLAEQIAERRELLELRLLVAQEYLTNASQHLKRGDFDASDAALKQLLTFLSDTNSA